MSFRGRSGSNSSTGGNSPSPPQSPNPLRNVPPSPKIRSLLEVFEPEDQEDFSAQFDEYTAHEDPLHIIYGQRLRYTKMWLALAAHGYAGTIRYSVGTKVRHGDFDPKSTFWHIKTASVWPFRGHLPVPDMNGYDGWQEIWSKGIGINSEIKESLFINEKTGKHEKIYVTFERQDLRFIQMQIAAGEYVPIDCIINLDKDEIESAQIIFKNKDGKIFSVDISPAELKEQSKDIQSVKNLAEIHKGKLKYSNDAILQDKLSKVFASKLFISNQSKTAKILRCEGYGENGWKVKNEPHIACNRDGLPVKGDIDLKNNFISIHLPLICGELTDIDAEDQDLISKTINRFEKMKSDLDKADEAGLGEIVQRAITRLKEHLNDPIEQRNQIICMRGNCELLQAAISIVEPDMQHGCDAISPLPPEDYAVILLPGIPPHGKPIRTYGEFEYLKFLFLQEQYIKDKIVDFHPCAFVPCDPNDKADNSRVNADVKVFDSSGNVLREYNNYADEPYSVVLTKLIQERSWLQLKKDHPKKFPELAKQIKEKMKIMQERASQGSPFQIRLEKGISVRLELLEKVMAMNVEDIDRRLAEIKRLKPNVSGEAEHSSSDTASLPSTLSMQSMSSTASSPPPSPEQLYKKSLRDLNHSMRTPSFTTLKKQQSHLFLKEHDRNAFDEALKRNLYAMLSPEDRVKIDFDKV